MEAQRPSGMVGGHIGCHNATVSFENVILVKRGSFQATGLR